MEIVSKTDNASSESSRLRAEPATKYHDAHIIKQQRFEGWTLTFALLIAVGLIFFLWRLSEASWSWIVMAGLAGIIGGLLHSLKWFYRTISSGEWESDQVWWRFMNPLVSGVMGLSIYVIFRSGIEAKAGGQSLPGSEGFYAYSIGFLTGLFADNAMSKLRDIAYVLFGPTAPPASKPKPPTDRGRQPR